MAPGTSWPLHNDWELLLDGVGTVSHLRGGITRGRRRNKKVTREREKGEDISDEGRLEGKKTFTGSGLVPFFIIQTFRKQVSKTFYPQNCPPGVNDRLHDPLNSVKKASWPAENFLLYSCDNILFAWL